MSPRTVVEIPINHSVTLQHFTEEFNSRTLGVKAEWVCCITRFKTCSYGDNHSVKWFKAYGDSGQEAVANAFRKMEDFARDGVE